MNGKLGFGIDFLQLLTEINTRSETISYDAATFARLMLVVEWGFSLEDQDSSSEQFWKLFEADALDEISTTVNRIANHFSEAPEEKCKLIADMFVIAILDQDISEKEDELIQYLGQRLHVSEPEIEKLATRANDILEAFYKITESVSITNLDKLTNTVKYGKYTNIIPTTYYLKKEPEWYWVINPPTVAGELAVAQLLATDKRAIGESKSIKTQAPTTLELAIREISVTFGATNIPTSDTDLAPLIEPYSTMPEVERIVKTMPRSLLLELWRAVGQAIPGWGPADGALN